MIDYFNSIFQVISTRYKMGSIMSRNRIHSSTDIEDPVYVDYDGDTYCQCTCAYMTFATFAYVLIFVSLFIVAFGFAGLVFQALSTVPVREFDNPIIDRNYTILNISAPRGFSWP